MKGTRNVDGTIFASGSATLGGPYATVDWFLGLQYQAQWIKWCRNTPLP